MSESKTALITGITGQDGTYLAEFLLEKCYQFIASIDAIRFLTRSVSIICSNILMMLIRN